MSERRTEPADDRPADVQIVGANVYRMRVLKIPRWSRERLAKLSGVGVETIRKIETARDGRPADGVQLSKLSAIARALGVETADLLRWDEGTRVYLDGPFLHALDGEGKGSKDDPAQSPLMTVARN